MQKIIPLSIPNIDGNEIKYVTEALEDGWVSSAGPYVDRFEQKISEYVKIKGAISCQNGTAGLHTALLTVGVNQEDIVIVPTLTFIAAVNPVKYIGATPIFMDCDDSLCMDPEKLRIYLEKECTVVDNVTIDNKTGKVIRAMVVVHVFGNMADMENIMQIAESFNIKVIEDATEALGTYYTEGIYQGKFAGTIGDIGVYSFNGNKIITTGGGGMLVSNNDNYLKRAKHLTTQAKEDSLYYIHDEIGYNYRMTCIQAAIGIAQLENLERYIETKNRNYEKYINLLKDIPGLELLECRQGIRCNRWFYALMCDKFDLHRDKIIEKMQEKGIQTRPIWGLIHMQKPYMNERIICGEKAAYYEQNVVNIPCSTNLSFEDIEIVIGELKHLI